MKESKNPVIYVTRDKERAEGIHEGNEYSIISGDGIRDTFDLLSDQKILEKIKKAGASLLVFKNNIQIEEFLKKEGVNLLNPSATLAEKIENKITQIEWLGELKDLLPPHRREIVKNIVWENKSLILQWPHGHTGDSTILVKDEKKLGQLKEKFPLREAKISSYIRGPVFTANAVVNEGRIFLGNISYQITGMLPFTENPFSTIGNDWSIPQNILTEKKIQEFNHIAAAIGKKMIDSGWQGLFGIDIIYDEELDRLFLLEINARQPASTTYESQLQEKAREAGVKGITTFEAHIKALKNERIEQSLIEINDGAQIVQRVTEKIKEINTSKLKGAGYNIIEYKNKKNNADLVRIQSDKGIMEAHNKLNRRGKEIVDLLYI